MNCNCCCTNTLNFCNQNVCEDIDFDIKAQVAGEHKMVVYFLNTQRTISEEFAINDEIVFSMDGLNENYQYTAELFDPNGNKILIRKNDVDYDCFKFQTILNVAV